MKFTDFVVRGAIHPKLTADSKEEVVRELVRGLVDAGRIDPAEHEAVVETVLERERLGSTGIGRGVAIPHAKHSSIGELSAAVGVSSSGVDFESLDGEPTDLFFLLVSPPERSKDHLSVLEYASRQLRNDLFCRLLRQSQTIDDIEQLLREADESSGSAFG
jgi:fructose-specific phosphotransferase system IIA component